METAAPLPGSPFLSSPKEVKLRMPDDFDGAKEKVHTFLNNVRAFLRANPAMYQDDERKILFMLALMNKGPAETWKNTFIDNAETIDPSTGVSKGYGTWNSFIDSFKTTFISSDEGALARNEIETIKQGENTADHYITNFRNVYAKTGINQDVTGIQYFQKGLNYPLREKIILAGAPTTLEGWYLKASQLDNLWRYAQATRPKQKPPMRERAKNYKRIREMQVNAVSAATTTNEERKKLGLCFNCGHKGHLARDCPVPKKSYPRSGQQLYHDIRSMIAELPENEQAVCLQEMEKAGF